MQNQATKKTSRRQMTSFVIGSQRTPGPLVSTIQVKGHLRLLRAFHNLRVIVEECKDRRIPAFAVQMDRDSRWMWFITLAIDRFERWVKSLKFVPLEKFISKQFPPIDVWMIWHAYLLNPCWYEEDCERLLVLQQLRLLNMFVVASIDVGKLAQNQPTESRIAAWHKQTGSFFDPFDAIEELTHKQMECPRCRTRVFVPFVNDNGTGYSEQQFSALCPLPGCRLKITKGNLAVAKFVRDLTESEDGSENYMAGSLFFGNGKRDPRRAKAIKDQLMQSSQFCRRNPQSSNQRIARLDWEREIKEGIGYSWPLLKDAIAIALKDQPEATRTKIVSAYEDDSPFSINLIAAVLRQGIFIKRIDELGWLRPGAFKDGDKLQVLEHALLRYHCFLDLAAASPNLIPVPTLDIDLIWHTHQLMGGRYGVDCEIYIGRRVDHPLTTEEAVLSTALDNTCHAWQSRFHIPYMQCGCTAPNETVFQRLIRIIRQYTGTRTHLQVSLHPDHLPATHPSIHNAVLDLERGAFGSFSKPAHPQRDERDLVRVSRPLGVRKKRSRKTDPEPPQHMEEGFVAEKMTEQHVPLSPAPPYASRHGSAVHFMHDV
ncbi:uncharacterized protein EDB91DRAFT_1200520 [Suillus paluster]|uniref:uncharacterized protein n=1 Tax=Suillus paluster TaxID=48578 RepID=UPI001B87D805|nr:uncharacterized protein EDB91DRAFT_1200520 [Suillus paluster]KAG1743622.1 hypothetical protein EDB91DRAFT_1200520 [Suillus paluster]